MNYLKKFGIFLLLVIFISCSTNDDDNNTNELPIASRNGSNTMGCTINGEVFIAKDDGTGQFLNCTYYNNNLRLTFSDLTQSGKNYITLNLLNTNIVEGEKYLLNKNHFYDGAYQGGSGIYGYHFTQNNEEGYKSFETTSQFIGELTITKFDLNNSIISGEFWFDGEGFNLNEDNKEVRNGRFDVKLSI